MIRLCAFDLDGTLTDSCELGHLLFKEVFRRLGFDGRIIRGGFF